MKIKIINLEKDSIKSISNNYKYIVVANNDKELEEIKKLSYKPIVILYNGAYAIDLENNNVIIEKSIDEKSYNKVIEYSKTHNVNTSLYKKNNNLYEIKMNTNNYHRRIIIPKLFKDLIPNINSITIDKDIIITDKNVSINGAIELVLEYLNIDLSIVEMEQICSNLSDNNYLNDLCWKGNILYES